MTDKEKINKVKKLLKIHLVPKENFKLFNNQDIILAGANNRRIQELLDILNQ